MMNNIFSFFRQYPKRGAIIFLIIFFSVLLFKPHLGYDWGPHKVRPGETLSEVLLEAFEGNSYIAYAAINNLREKFNVDEIWGNTQFFSQDGDVVYLKGNNFILKKPNGTEIQKKIFPDISYQKRLLQTLYHDLLIIFLAGIFIKLIVDSAKDKFENDIILKLSPHKIIKKLIVVSYYISAIIISLILSLLLWFVFVYFFDYFFSSMDDTVILVLNIIVLVIPLGLLIWFFKILKKKINFITFLIITLGLFSLIAATFIELFYWFIRL